MAAKAESVGKAAMVQPVIVLDQVRAMAVTAGKAGMAARAAKGAMVSMHRVPYKSTYPVISSALSKV